MRWSLALLLVWLMNPSLAEAMGDAIAFVRTGTVAHRAHDESQTHGHECPPTHAHCLCCARGSMAPVTEMAAVRLPSPRISAHVPRPESRWDDVASAPPFRPPIA